MQLALSLCLLSSFFVTLPKVSAQAKQLRVTGKYINIPIGGQAK